MIKNCYSCKWFGWVDGTYYIGPCCQKSGITRGRDENGNLSQGQRHQQVVDNGLKDNCNEWGPAKAKS